MPREEVKLSAAECIFVARVSVPCSGIPVGWVLINVEYQYLSTKRKVSNNFNESTNTIKHSAQKTKDI